MQFSIQNHRIGKNSENKLEYCLGLFGFDTKLHIKSEINKYLVLFWHAGNLIYLFFVCNYQLRSELTVQLGRLNLL